jgi:hypothetical protein
MLIHLAARANADERLRLGEFLSRPRGARTPDEVRWVRDRMAAYGSLEYAQQVAHWLAGAARHECAPIYGDRPWSRDRQFTEELPTLVLQRT